MTNRDEGIQVRLTAENQIFLDTRRPTREPIAATRMEKLVPGFKSGSSTFLKINYPSKNAQLLTPEAFVNNFPALVLRSKRKLAWMIGWAEVRISNEAERTSLAIRQAPPIEGVSDYVLNGRLVSGLRFQKGSVFLTMEIVDAFSQPTNIQLHHNGHQRAWLSRQTKASARIRMLSFDGVRLRILYHLSKGNSSTVVYLSRPSILFRLSEADEFPRGIEPVGLEKVFRMDGIRPVRSLEETIINHGRFYETGRIGAEISYSIVSEVLGIKDLILNEPARGGTDLFTSDRKVLVESRFITSTTAVPLSDQIALELVRLARRLRNDFRWNPSAEVGYAVLSYLDKRRINTLVAKLAGPK